MLNNIRPGGFPEPNTNSYEFRKKKQVKRDFQIGVAVRKRNGYKLSEALKCAWLNIKLKAEMKKRIVKFYFQKIDGSLREAYGTMNPDIIPAPTGTRKPADTVQTYFDTEKQEYRCFKKANLIRIA